MVTLHPFFLKIVDAWSPVMLAPITRAFACFIDVEAVKSCGAIIGDCDNAYRALAYPLMVC